MLSCNIVDQGTIDTTLPSTSDPSYQAASLSLFIKQQFAALRTAGFVFQKAQTSDLSDYVEDLNGWLADAQEREDDILSSGVSAVSAVLPDILTIGTAYMSGGASAVAGIVLQMLLERSLGGGQGALAGYMGGNPSGELTELIDKLEEIRVQIDTILTEFSINVYNDPESSHFTVGQ